MRWSKKAWEQNDRKCVSGALLNVGNFTRALMTVYDDGNYPC
jgi:hypothetical protein